MKTKDKPSSAPVNESPNPNGTVLENDQSSALSWLGPLATTLIIAAVVFLFVMLFKPSKPSDPAPVETPQEITHRIVSNGDKFAGQVHSE
jgi:hypothetical protein